MNEIYLFWNTTACNPPVGIVMYLLHMDSSQCDLDHANRKEIQLSGFQMLRVSILEQYMLGTIFYDIFYLLQGVGMIIERHPDGKL
jgi:hypothetical protein